MDQPSIFEDGESIQQLRSENFDELCAEALELVLLDQLVQVGREQLKHQAQMVFVDERVPQSKNVVLIMRVALLVQLRSRTISKCSDSHIQTDSPAPVL